MLVKDLSVCENMHVYHTKLMTTIYHTTTSFNSRIRNVNSDKGHISHKTMNALFSCENYRVMFEVWHNEKFIKLLTHYHENHEVL